MPVTATEMSRQAGSNQMSEHVALVIDSSESMGRGEGISKFEISKQICQAFVRQRLMKYSNDPINVVPFNHVAWIEFTSYVLQDRNAIERAIKSLVMAPGTSIGAGLEAAGLALSYSRTSPKLVVLCTDGQENVEPSAIPIAKQLKESGVVIYVIGVGDSPRTVNEDLLMQLASRVDDCPAYRFARTPVDVIGDFRRQMEKRGRAEEIYGLNY
jgi:Mg-chelatase subunit ChlD